MSLRLIHLVNLFCRIDFVESCPKCSGSSITVLIHKCLCFPAPPVPPRLPDCLCCPICPQPQYLLPLCLRLFLNLVAIISYFSPTFKLNVLKLASGLTLNKSCSMSLSHHFLYEIDQ